MERCLQDGFHLLLLRAQHRADRDVQVVAAGCPGPARGGHQQHVRPGPPVDGRQVVQAQQQFAADAAAAEEPQRPALSALVQLELEAEDVAHRGLRDERLVVLGRAAGQDVRGVLEVERRLDDGPPAGHVVEPVVQGGEDQGELQPQRVRVEVRRDPVPGPLGDQVEEEAAEPGPGAGEGVGVQQFQGEPREVTAARPVAGGARLAGLQRVVADLVEDDADPVPLGDDGHDLRGVLPAVPLGLADLGEPVVQQPLVEGERAEVVGDNPVPQRLALDQQRVQPVGGDVDRVDGVGPVVDLLRRQLQSALPGQLSDLVRLDLVQPRVG